MIKNIDIHSNKDINLQDIDLGEQEIKTTIHNINTVYVIFGCTMNPISIDI
ncbi:MAG TPA: hypothetical protein VFJ23_04370 [Candidatus Nitrosotalea sp.]|nr:hypothetical protein [Candidatus Nitrosotalea sp.]